VIRDLPPVIRELQGKVILEKVEKPPLVLLFAQKVPPIILGDFRRGVLPRLELLGLNLVDVVQLLLGGAKEVGRGEDVRGVVVELQVVVDDGVIGVVALDEVLQTPGAAALGCFDIVDVDGWQVDALDVIADQPVDDGDVGEQGGHVKFC
jgi:hypothetical protein